MSRPQLPVEIVQARLVIVARRLAQNVLKSLVELAEGEIPAVFEITMDSPTAIEDISWLREKKIAVGAGTVFTRDEAKSAIDAGAQFLVAPHFDRELVDWAMNKGFAMVPGALTPTEIVRAWEAGAAAVKVFPASVAGPQLLREVRGPLGHIPLMPTGGVSADNARAFLDAGAIAVGVGGWLTGTPKEQLRERWNDLMKAVERSE